MKKPRESGISLRHSLAKDLLCDFYRISKKSKMVAPSTRLVE